MNSISAALANAIHYHQAGQLAVAEQVYRQILAAEPNHASALHLLGVIQHQRGKHELAVEWIRRAIAVDDEQPIFHNNLGEAHRALKQWPMAIACFQRAIQLAPDLAGPYYNLGNVHKAQGALDAAADSFLQALQLQPNHIEALNNLGNVRRDQKRLDEAIVCYRRALQIEPRFVEAHNNLGNAWKDQRRLDEAVAAFQTALRLKPDHAEAHCNLGNALQMQGDLAGATVLYQKALQLRPEFAEAWYNLGFSRHVAGEFSAAIDAYQQALRLKPDDTEVLNNLAVAWKDTGDLDAAIAGLRKTLELDPEHRAAHSNLLLTVQYRSGVTRGELALAHQAYQKRFAAPLATEWRPHDNSRDPERRLRVGFVSPDFGRHPVGYFLIRVLEQLDLGQFETVCYHDRWKHDELTTRFQKAAGQWRDVAGQDDDALAKQIRADRIDILFDLTGHTANNRLLVFARKPAPIQITWIGYEGTTGVAAIDYIIADRFVVPAGAERDYQERVMRMPNGYVCYDPPLDAPPVGPLPALQNGFVTFASFNNLAKLTPDVVAIWAKILRCVPDARLILKYKGLGDPQVRARFSRLFAEAGARAEQLELQPPSSYAEYLAAYRQVDIALDPFPFSGGATTCEALWMGAPVVSYAGETFAGRHALSFLSQIGLTDLIADNLDAYVEQAATLSKDLPRLAELRAGLRSRMESSPLCDGPQFASDFSAILRNAWRERVGQGLTLA